METKDAIRTFRTKKGLSQDELAEKVFVTRQAVSRWETGETVPSTDTLKELSRVLDVSMNALLGSPRTLICQCCGMPLEEGQPDEPGARRRHQRGILQVVLCGGGNSCTRIWRLWWIF